VVEAASGEPDPVGQIRQARLSGHLDANDAATLAARRGEWMDLELRDQEGNPFLQAPARLAIVEMEAARGALRVVVDADVVFSVAPAYREPAQQSATIKDLLSRIKRGKRVQHVVPRGRRLSAAERAVRNRAIIADRAQGASVPELVANYDLSPWMIRKIFRAAERKRPGE
jgi:hypothetical protein